MQSEKDLNEFKRDMFPICQNKVYLANAAQSPLNLLTQQRLDSYLQFALLDPDHKPSSRDPIKVQLSALLGGESSDYAIVGSTGIGLSIVASGYEWKKGDNVVITNTEHWNNTFCWLGLQERGVEVRMLECNESGSFQDYEKWDKLIDENTRIVSVAAVNFSTGFRINLKKLSQIVKQKGAIFVVDGIQACGVCPLNIEEDGIDILAGAAFKWLLGLHGIGFLYVSKNIQSKINPIMPGMFSARQDTPLELNLHGDARQFETGTIAYSLLHAWGAGMEIVTKIGVKSIYQRILFLGDGIIKAIQQKGFKIISPIEKEQQRSAIITFTTGDDVNNEKLVKKLEKQGVIISLRGGKCRVSPNFFNNIGDIQKFSEAIQTY